MAESRKRFRAILDGDRCFLPASVFDAISARIAEDLGFEAGVMMGSYSALAVLGAPDMNLLTLPELAEQCRRICRAGNLPLIVDADHGFGNALNAMRCVEELERAGVAALTIEDTLIPSPFRAGPKARIVSVDEAVARMRAAVTARTDPDLAVVGRTNALAVSTLEEAVERVKAYEAAGVDAIFISPKTREQIEAIASAVTVPLLLGSVSPDLADAAFLAGQRVRICLQGHLTIAASVRAMYETMKAIRAGTPTAKIPNIASSDLMRRTTRAADYERWAADFT